MRIKWRRYPDTVGLGFGYTSHRNSLAKALQKIGVVFDEDAPVVVSLITAGEFEPEPKKFNVLYTMYECIDIPNSWIPKVNEADLIVVPCRHNKALFSKYTKKPVEVCWEGVDVEVFGYKKREFPPDGEPFVYLWVGASNERKGYKHVIAGWAKFREAHPGWNCLLIMKTTQIGEQERIIGYEKGRAIKVKMPEERIFRADDAIVDTRRLPLIGANGGEGLVDLYHKAHCFLFPTMGEGFGLTLAEAMATGLPCIYTDWSGPRDFISDREGYPLRWHYTKVTALTPLPDGTVKKELESYAASADIDHLVRRMEQVYLDYGKALEKGKRAAERVRQGFTWEISAKSFVGILEKHERLWREQ